MGYTGKTIEVVTPYLDSIKSVCDLGSQNNYSVPYLPAPYISEWYKEKGKEYMCIDLNGENDAKKWDLSEPLKTTKKFDLVTDIGTGEHVNDFYQCLANIDKLTKVGGLIIRENPKTGNWPGHGFNYVDQEFYTDLALKAGYEILLLEEHPAMGNVTDGWNVIAVLRKTKAEFITKEQFPTFYKS